MSLHVVGHDGTERGDDAVALARRLSALYDAELLAVHVIGMPPTRDRFTGPVLDRLEDAAGVVLARARRGLEDTPGPAPRAVHASSPAAGLQAVCDAEGAGLVTVGPGHRGPIGRVLAGTTAERLLSGAPCPVALAPRGYAEAVESFERVVAGYDGSEESGLALQVAAELASLAGVRLRIVAVAEPPTATYTAADINLAEVVERSVRQQAERLAAEGAGRVAGISLSSATSRGARRALHSHRPLGPAAISSSSDHAATGRSAASWSGASVTTSRTTRPAPS